MEIKKQTKIKKKKDKNQKANYPRKFITFIWKWKLEKKNMKRKKRNPKK